MRKILLSLSVCLVIASARGATTPASTILNQASSFRGFSDNDLQIAKAYSMAASVGLATLPVASIMTAAYSQGFGGLSSDSLQVIQAYAASQTLVDIFVTPNTNSSTYGIQEALNSVPPGGPQWGTNVTGANIHLAAGDYYVTNGAFYSNTFPYNIRMEGAGILATRLIYVSNNNSRTNLLRFCGGGNPNGGLSLPGHVQLENMTFTSVTNDLLELVVITNISYAKVRDCNFTGREITTNNTHGAQLSIDGPYPSQPPSNVGLVVGNLNDHGTFVEDCFWANLACGLNNFSDHLYVFNFKTAFVGVYIGGGSGADGTGWPNTSAYFLGPSILLHGGLNTTINGAHFYTANGGVVADASSTVIMRDIQYETCSHATATFVPSTTIFTLNGTAITDDGSRWVITHGPYAYNSSTAYNIQYELRSTFLSGISGVNVNSIVMTNAARFSALTNLCSQPAAGFTPNFNQQNDVASTNNGANTAVIFAAGLLPNVFGGDVIYHETLIHKATANDGAIILPAPYVTNISGVFRCTNNTLLTFRIWPGFLTNVFSQPIN